MLVLLFSWVFSESDSVSEIKFMSVSKFDCVSADARADNDVKEISGVVVGSCVQSFELSLAISITTSSSVLAASVS